MIFDTNSKDIILVSYPSGGFGNFIYHVLTTFADGTIKISNNDFDFRSNGDSHMTNRYCEDYFHDPYNYTPNIDIDTKDKKIVVLCDNGINNDGYKKVIKVFPNATIVRAVIDQGIRPVIYQTLVQKAMSVDITQHHEYHIENHWTDSGEEYAARENFTLFYHNWPFKWHTDESAINVSLEKLVTDPVSTLIDLINRLDMTVVDHEGLDSLCKKWSAANATYFFVYHKSNTIMQALDTNTNIDVSDVTELYQQGYINYCIEAKYHVTIPVYDYKDWFKSTLEISDMIKKLHV